MVLNTTNNIINVISNLNDDQLEQVDLEVFLVSKAESTDDLYISKREQIDQELNKWIKKNIKNELNKLKIEDENRSNKFYVDQYDYELTKNDYIAELPLGTAEDLKTQKDNLITSFTSSNFIHDKDINFQVLKLTYDGKEVYFVYYRGVKLSATKKKNIGRIPTFRHREHLAIQDHDIVEFGGKIELMILEDSFFIVSPRTLEYAFNYTDHISIRKNNNIDAITKMSFFDEDPNVHVFIEKTNQYMISRRLAGIKPETLRMLEESFVSRCMEMREIKEKIPINKKDKENYLSRYEVLWPLYNHIDVFEKKVRIDPDESIEPLIYFFADKIVESFLTKELKES